ncbi:MAG: hypothetical protein O7I93_19040 [Gemmatimonadetes bacterium]|nr:hypothetical protein [Gemmatimonadota bacterium]
MALAGPDVGSACLTGGRGSADTRGAALPVVVYGLAIVGALAAASFWMLLLDRRAGIATIALQKAVGEAERAALAPLESWSAARYNSMPVGSNLEHTGPRGKRVTTVRRVSLTLFEVIGTGFAGGETVVQRVGLLVQLPSPVEIPPGPLVTAGSVTADTRVRIRVPDGSPGEEICSPGDSRLGSLADAPAGEAATNRFEDMAAWVLLANKVVPPGRYVGLRPSHTGRSCHLQDIRNWGAPDVRGSPCLHYRPVILVPGDLDLTGGVGQGVLIVEGSLRLGGDFTFAGLILVGGDLRIWGGGAHVVGTIQVGGPWGGVSTHLEGEVRIDYAPCLVRRAMIAAGRATPLPSRAWFYPMK